MGYNPYSSGYMPYPSTPTSGPSYLPAELHLACSVADGDFIYLSYENMTNAGIMQTSDMQSGEAGFAIFEASGSDDYEYVSHIALFNGGSRRIVPTPTGILVQDNLVVIGALEGTIYLVDISDKDDPTLINELFLVDSDYDWDYDWDLFDAGTLAMKDDLLL